MKHSQNNTDKHGFHHNHVGQSLTLFALAGSPLLAPYNGFDPVGLAGHAVHRLGAVRPGQPGRSGRDCVAWAWLLGSIGGWNSTRQGAWSSSRTRICCCAAHAGGCSLRTWPDVEVVCHDWSDGSSTYELRPIPASGKAVDFGNSTSRKEATAARTELLFLFDAKEKSVLCSLPVGVLRIADSIK